MGAFRAQHAARCFLGIGLTAVAASACGGRGEGSPPPHVVLVTADALRVDHLSMSGYPRETSPHLDAFAAAATRFANAVTVIPKTCPSFASLFSGRLPAEHGVRHNNLRFPDEAPLLAQLLRARGYRTAAFVSNPVLREEIGLARGFEHYELFTDGDGVAQVNAAFAAWAAGEWEQPTFVWLHYIDPHGPYEPPAELEALFTGDQLDRDPRRVPTTYRRLRGFGVNKVLGAIPVYQQRDGENRAAAYVRRYDAEIRYVDQAFGEVLGLLRERGLYDPSAVLFLSDHGESLGEHDYWFEHGWFAYDATLRVPLVLKEPGQTRGRVVAEQVSVLDVFPTVLDLAGVQDRPPSHGVSLLEPVPEGRAVVVENSARYPRSIVGFRGGGTKFLSDREGDAPPELYDLTTDPAESSDRSGREPDALRAAKERLARLLDELRPIGSGPREEAAQGEVLEQLKRLGYGE